MNLLLHYLLGVVTFLRVAFAIQQDLKWELVHMRLIFEDFNPNTGSKPNQGKITFEFQEQFKNGTKGLSYKYSKRWQTPKTMENWQTIGGINYVIVFAKITNVSNAIGTEFDLTIIQINDDL